jgi:hypothetical protein
MEQVSPPSYSLGNGIKPVGSPDCRIEADETGWKGGGSV